MKQYDMAINLGQSILGHDYHKAETLLRAGADPNLADMDDSLLFAMSEKDETMLALLRRYGANPSKSLIQARNVEDARRLLGMGANPNAPVGHMGLTPLAEQCLNGNVEVATFLLKKGGDPTVRDEDGWSILQRIAYAAPYHPENAKAYAQLRGLLTETGKHR